MEIRYFGKVLWRVTNQGSKELKCMKRRDLIRKLESIGFVFKEHGGNHDTYKRGNDTEQVPRHKEINEIIR